MEIEQWYQGMGNQIELNAVVGMSDQKSDKIKDNGQRVGCWS